MPNPHHHATPPSPDALAALLARLPNHAGQALPPDTRLTNIQWRADCCDSGSILFFQRLDDGRSDTDIYQRYLATSRFAALVTNRPLDGIPPLPGRGLYVTPPEHWAETVKTFCDLCYPLDWNSIDCLGVTGTNGKTTTVKYLEAILTARGRRVLSIGTLGVFRAGEALGETGFTSPPLIALRELLYQQRGAFDTLVMEASSHALHQDRLHGIPFAHAGWTSFSQDHLDYHRTSAAYFAAKAAIRGLIQPGGRLYCASPAVIARLQTLDADAGPDRESRHALAPAQAAAAPAAEHTSVPLVAVAGADLGPAIIAQRPFLALDFNRRNYALALALANAVAPAADPAPWRSLRAVPGRFESHTWSHKTIVIDFAHTPEALDSTLGAIRAGFPGARILTLFGCGGDRDRGKRPLMGTAAARHSDLVLLTSDNPRTEDPAAIIADILPGVAACQHEVVVERDAAIARLFDILAARPAAEPWVALIAGKGHERYLERQGQRLPYADQDEVAKQLRRVGWR